MIGRRSVRRFAALVALLGAFLMSSGLALVASAGSASALAAACVPSEAYTDHQWSVDSPGDGWVKTDQHQDVPGTGSDAVYRDQFYVYHGNVSGTPSPDDPNWAANDGNHAGVPFDGSSYGVPFNVSNGNSGNGSWFMVKKVLVTPAVPPTQEYLWTYFHPAVTCTTVTPQDASGTLDVTAPQTCDGLGSFTATGVFATPDPASGTGLAGDTVTTTLHAASGHLFSNGTDTLVLSKQIPSYDGQCSDVSGPKLLTPSVSYADCPAGIVLGGTTFSPADLSANNSSETVDGVSYQITGTVANGSTASVTAYPVNEGDYFGENSTVKNFDAHTFTTTANCTPGKTVVDPPAQTTSTTPTVSTPVTTVTKTKAAKKSTTKSTVADPGTVIPSVVHAGLGSSVASMVQQRRTEGLSLLAAGALVLVAGGVGLRRPRGARAGAHRA